MEVVDAAFVTPNGPPESKSDSLESLSDWRVPESGWYGVRADRAALQRRLDRVGDLARRLAENIAFQRDMIEKLERGGHDVRAAGMFLRRLEAAHAKHATERDRLFKELANGF